MHILAVDPGQTTGICILGVNKERDDFTVEYVGEMSWDDRFRQSRALVYGMWPPKIGTAATPPEVVVIEQFRLRQGKAYQQAGSTFPSIYVQAIIETFVWEWNRRFALEEINATQVVTQEPIAMARVQILPDHHYLVTGSEHMKDAYRHGRYYFETKVKVR